MKTLFNLALILILTACVTTVALRRNTISKLCAENQSLASDAHESEKLALENQSLEFLRQQNEEVLALRSANKDLPRLRNEIGQLRKQIAEMAHLRLENQRLAARPISDTLPTKKTLSSMVFSRESMIDVGLNLPLNTLQTAMHALFSGDVKRMKDCMTPEILAKRGADESDEKAHAGMVKETENLSGYEVVSHQQMDDGRVLFELKFLGSGQTNQIQQRTVEINLKQIGNEWKIDE